MAENSQIPRDVIARKKIISQCHISLEDMSIMNEYLYCRCHVSVNPGGKVLRNLL